MEKERAGRSAVSVAVDGSSPVGFGGMTGGFDSIEGTAGDPDPPPEPEEPQAVTAREKARVVIQSTVRINISPSFL
jgi:hypothetical protein